MSIDMRLDMGRCFRTPDEGADAYRQAQSTSPGKAPTVDRMSIIISFLRGKKAEYLTRLERANSELDYKEAHICFTRLSYIRRQLEDLEPTKKIPLPGPRRRWFHMGHGQGDRAAYVQGTMVGGTGTIGLPRARLVVKEAAPDRTRVVHEYLKAKEAEHESQRGVYTSARDLKKAYERHVDLWTVRKLLKELQPDPIAVAPVEPDSRRTFVISSIFLARLHSYLVGQGVHQNEAQCFATGVLDKERGVAYPSLLLTTRMSVRNPVRCRSDDRATLDTFAMADDFGHPLLMVAHLHPGEMIYPSGQDLMTHDAYERGGYRMLGAVLVRSGMVRFYSSRMPFKVVVYGSGAERVEDDLWRLTRFDTSAGQVERGAV